MKSYNITALCLCTLIGAGFATGRELVTYFVDYGIYGFVGIAVTSLLFALVSYILLICPFNSIEELTKNRLPKYAAYMANNIVFLFLIVLYSGMLAAAGEVFSLIFGADINICKLLTALLCMTVISTGPSVLSDLSGILFIPMALIIFIISGSTAGTNITFPPENIITLRAAASPVIYLSYNMITAIALIITLPKTKYPRTAAIQTGLFIFILSTVLALPLYTHYSSIRSLPLPIMAILQDGWLKYIYIFFLLLAIFTTAVSSGYSAANFINKKTGGFAAACIMTALAYALSLIGFTDIVDKVYFIFGIAGLVLLFILIPIFP